MRAKLLGITVVLILSGVIYWNFRTTTTIPVLTADPKPYKRFLNADETKDNIMTDSTVHAVIGGQDGDDPSMQNLAPPIPPPPLPDDAPAGMTIPKVAP